MRIKKVITISLLVGTLTTLTGCEFSRRVKKNSISENYLENTLGYKKHPTKFKDIPRKLKDDMKCTTNQFKDDDN